MIMQLAIEKNAPFGRFGYNCFPFEYFFGILVGLLAESMLGIMARESGCHLALCMRVLASWSIFVGKFLHEPIKSFTFAC